MRIKLLKDARIWHKAGEILEVSPEERHFLVSTEGAVEVDAVKTPAAKPTEVPEKPIKAETPEKKEQPKAQAKKPVTKKK